MSVGPLQSRRFGLLAIALAAMVTTAGCGMAGQAIMTGLPIAGSGLFGALADLPDIDAQITQYKIAADENGTRVKRLPTPGQAKGVTFLTYKALDNNLGMTLNQHLNTLERVGSSTAVNALALTDDIGPKNSRKYYLRRDANEKAIGSPYVPTGADGDIDSGSAPALTNAMRWGFGTYPSRLRWLDINNHGGGYYGIAQDDQTDHIIRLPQLAAGLVRGANGKKLDVLSFDACLMASTEVAYELRDTARFMVASEDSSYALGMNYDRVLGSLASKPAIEADALSRELVLQSQRKGKTIALYTISAIDLSKAERVTMAVNGLSDALLKCLPAHKPEIMMSLNAVKAFYVAGPDKSDFDHRDLNEVVDQLRQRVTDPAVQTACQAVKTTLFNKNGAILFSRAANEQQGVARGLSIYLPTKGEVDPIYKDTAFARTTHWDEFLAALK